MRESQKAASSPLLDDGITPQLGTTVMTEKPRLAYSLLEMRAPFEALSLAALMPLLKKAPKGDGQPVLVLPGFMTGDSATFVLRRFLAEQGFTTHAWKQGRNPGLREDIYNNLEEYVKELYQSYGQKISLVGWSLGGIYARTLGHNLSDMVCQVITLGSPFGLNNNISRDDVAVSGAVMKLYERLNPNLYEDKLVNGVPIWETPPPVPSTAIYSAEDGVACWKYCIDDVAERTENIRIFGSHMGLTHNPLVLYALTERLAQPQGQWQHFRPQGIRKFFYRQAPANT